MSLTLIIPTYNEERFIEQALGCASFADEIIVIDSYSTDKTLALAEKYKCTILQRAFDDFSSQKNFAIKQASHPWVFILDADEYIIPKMQKEILELIQTGKDTAYEIPRHNFFMNRFLKHGRNGSDSVIRLIQKEKCHYEGLVHERMIVDGSIGISKNYLYHYTYSSLSDFLVKKNRYSSLQAENRKQKKINIGLFHLIVKPAFRFFNEFILRVGFLDGIPGLTSTRMNGYGVLSRYIKLRNLQGKNKDKRLKNFDTYSNHLNEEAKAETVQKKYFGFQFWLNPKLSFLKHYFLKGNFTKGLEGYALSYMQSFKTFQKMVYGWLKNRNLE